MKDVGRGAAFHIMKLLSQQRRDGAGALQALDASESTIRCDLKSSWTDGQGEQGTRRRNAADSQFADDEPTMAKKEVLAVVQKKCIAKAAKRPSSPQRILSFWTPGEKLRWRWPGAGGPALDARYVTNGVAARRLLARRVARIFLVGGLRRRDGGHHRRCGSPQPAAVQLLAFLSQRRGAGRRIRPPTPRKRLSRPRSCAGREAWFLVDDFRSSPASTRRSSPSCPAARS